MSKGWRSLSLALVFFGLLMACVAFLSAASATTIYVDDSYGSDDPAAHQWTTVQEGIYDAAPGDTVYVYDGTYNENVTIANDSVSVDGESRGGVILQPASSSIPSIDVRSSGVRISNLSIEGGGYSLYASGSSFHNGTLENVTAANSSYTCVYIYSASDWTVHDSSLSNCGSNGIEVSGSTTYNPRIWGVNITAVRSHGIYFASVRGGSVHDLTILNPAGNSLYLYASSDLSFENLRLNSSSNYAYGIYAYFSDFVRLINSTIELSGPYAYAGLYLDQCRFWTLRSNSFPDHSAPIAFNYNAVQTDYYNHDADASNTVNGLPMLWVANATAGSWNSSYGWIALVNSSNVSVTSTSPLARNVEGILLVGTNDSVVHDVNSSANQYGLRAWISHRNHINDSEFRANLNGALFLWRSNGNQINRALLRPDSPGADYGLSLADTSNNNTMEASDCGQFTYCVYAEYLTNDLFVANSTFNASTYGILSYSQFGPWVSRTTITNSSYAVYLYGYYYYGYYLASFSVSNSTFYGNAYALQCYYCQGGLLADNSINVPNYSYGIYGYLSDFVRLINNTVELSGPYAYAGLYLDQCRFWTLRDNSFSNQSSPIVFSYSSIQAPYFSHDADASNTVNGLAVLWLVNQTSGSWNASYGWIALVNSSNISVTSTSPLSRNTEGVLLVATNDSVVHDVNSTGNQYGLRAWISHRNSINDSQFRANLFAGLYLWRSNGNHINRALLRPDTPNADYGISLADTSNNNTVESSNCDGFYYCVYADYLTNDLFVANSTINGSSYGILSYSQFGPWISRTTLSNNSYALHLFGYYYYGYYLAGFSVSNSTFVGNSYGVQCYYCRGGLIADSSFTVPNYGYGIYGYLSDFVRLINNTVELSGTSAYGGLYLDQSRFWTLRNNAFSNQSSPIVFNYGYIQAPYFSHDADASNTVNGLPVLWLVNETSGSWNASYGWIALVNSSNISVTSTSPLSRNTEGVLLVETNDSVVHDVNSSANQYGLRAWQSHRNRINDSEFRANLNGGLFLWRSNGNHINRALLRPDTPNADYGISLADTSNNNTVESTDCEQFYYCVYADYLTSDLFVANSTINASTYAILSYAQFGPWVTGTRITNSSYAIYLYGYYYYGYYLANFSVANSTFYANAYAIQCYYCRGGLIADNHIDVANYSYGIYGYLSDFLRLLGNTIELSGPYASGGLYFDQSRFWTLRNNAFSNQSSPIVFNYGYIQAPYFSHDADASNTVNGLSVLWIVNATSGSWNGSYGWMALVNSSNISVTSTSPLSRNTEGILLVETNDSVVHDVNSSANQYGLRAWMSHRNRINDSEFRANLNGGLFLWRSNGNHINRALLRPDTANADYGISLADTSNNNTVESTDCDRFYYCVIADYLTNDLFVVNSTFNASSYAILSYAQFGPWVSRTTISNSSYAVYLYGYYYYGYNLVNFSVSQSTLFGNSYGLQCAYCQGGRVVGNRIESSAYGIYLYSASNLVIRENTVANTSSVLYLDTGSNSNKIFLNNFYLTNGSTYDSGTGNQYDNGYPSGGNYWSNTTHTDLYRGAAQATAGSDGINDTSLNLNYGKTDNYPLSEPWPPYVTLVSPANLSVIVAGTTLDLNISYYFDTVQYALNNGTTSNLTSPWDISTGGFPDGALSVQVWANDSWYNLSYTFLFVVDSTGPTITLDSPAAGGTYPAGTQLNFTVADAHLASNTTWNNGSADNPFAAPFDLSTTGWAEGDYNITVRAWDTAGNSRTSVFFFRLDSTAPVISLVSPANNSFIAAGTVIDVDVADAHLNLVTWDNGSGPFPLLSPFNISTSGWAGGTYSVTVTANDTGGLSTTRVFVFTIDATPPTISLVSPANNSVFDPGQLLNFDVSDSNLAAVTWNNGSGANPLASPFDLSTAGWADGAYDVTIVANDTAGNVATRVFHFEVDSAGPAVTFSSPSNNSYIVAGSTLDFAVSDAHLSTVAWTNGSASNALASPFDISTAGWADGPFSVWVNATDAVGHETHVLLRITVDSLAPSVGLVTPANNSYFGPGPALNFTVADANLDLSRVNWSNGGAPTAFSVQWNISTGGWADGIYTVTVRAADLAGNAVTGIFRFTVDSLQPSITLTTPANGSFIPAGTVLNFSISDTNLNASAVNWSNGGAATTFSVLWNVSTSGWADGSVTVTVRAADLAGNGRTALFTFTVDSTLPTVSLTSPSNGAVVRAGTAVVLSVADTNLNASAVNWSNGGAATAFSTQWSIDTAGWADGNYTVTVRAADLAGNSRVASYTIVIDSTSPAIVLTSPAAGSFVPTGTSIVLSITDGHLANATYERIWGPNTTGPLSFGTPYQINTVGWTDGDQIIVRADDAAGNAVNYTVPITFDSLAPVIAVGSPANGSIVRAGTVLRFNITEANLVNSTWNNGTGGDRPFGTPWDVPTDGWIDRTYNITVVAQDAAGTVVTGVFRFEIDSTPPQVQLLSPANGSWLVAGAVINFGVTDAHALNVSVNGAPTSLSPAYDLDTTTWSDGTYTLSILASDPAGNNASLTALFRLDSTAPVITLTPANLTYVRAGTNLTFNIAEANLASASWRFGSGSFGPFASNFTVSTAGLADGALQLDVRALDFAGNSVTVPFAFVIDSTLPTLVLVAPVGVTYLRSDVPIDLAISDASLRDIVVKLNGNAVTAPDLGGGIYRVDLRGASEGQLELDVTVTDLAGNVATLYRLYKLDDTPPELPATLPMAFSGNEDGVFSFHASAIDNAADPSELNFTWTFDTAKRTLALEILYGENATFIFTDPGNYAVNLTVSDPAGNLNGTTFTVNILDITPPNLTIIQKFMNATEDEPLYLNRTVVNASDVGGNLTWVWSDGAGGNATSTGPNITWLFVDPGVYNLTLVVKDPQNNTAAGYIIVTVRDKTPPVILINGPGVIDVFLDASFNSTGTTDNDANSTAADWNFTWQFEKGTTILAVRYGQSASFRPNVSGDVTVRLFVRDKSNNEANVSTTLRVNLPPIIISSPPTETNLSSPWSWTPDVIDPEGQAVTINISQGPAGMVVSGDTVTWTPSANQTGPQNVTLAFFDGFTTVFRSFTVFVVDPAAFAGNHLPVFESEPPTDARVRTDYLYNITVTDADGDPLTITVTGLDGSTYNTATHLLRWTPPWQPGPDETFARDITVKVTAFDGKQTSTQEFLVRFRNPPNIWPELIGSFSVGNVHPNDVIYVRLLANWTDRDDLIGNLTFSINDTDSATRALVAGILRWHVDLSNPADPVLVIEIIGNGTVTFNFVARDPSGGKSDNALVVVNSAAGPRAPDGLPSWLWLLLALAGVGVVLGVVVSLRRSHSAARVAQTALDTASRAPTERVIVQQMPAAATEAKKDTYLIEGVFVIYQDGRMIYSKTDIGNVKLEDPELIASMFSAVTSFIKDSFKQQGELNRLGFGDNTILIERGTYVFMAAIVYGEPTPELADSMRETIRTIENAYAGIIEEWDGSVTSLEAIDQYLAPFLATTAHLSRADVDQALKEKGVKMLSELEFFQGFVRLKCGVKNDTDSVITKVTVSIDFNEDVLRLHHIEPETYKRQGSEVQLGVLNPGEKVSVAYYFDPQICTESQIDGIARYRDAKGSARSVTMKTRKAEVVCPIFFTKEHANTAMLKRLVEGELDQRDSKVFNVVDKPAAVAWTELFALIKEVVLSHDVHMVREFLTQAPFHGEAWFYGETKVKGYKIVIRTSLIEDGGRIEFFAASTVIPAITGLLAEFNHTLQSMIGRKFSTVKLEAEYSETVKDDIQKKSLMAQMGEGELEGGETEQDD